MSTVTTLQDRKRARVEQIRAGFAELRELLSEYGRSHGGKFWVYGSAAAGRFHFESDIDVLVDFDEAAASAAVAFAEREGARLGLRLDVQPKAWCSASFLKRIEKSTLVLP
jgi:predicted nucleotidyltransferase